MKQKVSCAFLACVLVFGVMNFTSCSKEDEFELKSSATVSLYTEGTSQIVCEGTANYESENEFVASVNEKGVITGEHVGETWILINGSRMVKVTINPFYKEFTEPVMKFGATKSEIKAAEQGSPILDDDTSLGYKGTGREVARLYTFSNNKLTSSSIIVKLTDGTLLTNFLIERYVPIDVLGKSYLAAYVNGYSEDEISLMISQNYYRSNYLVTYFPYNK